MGYGFASPYIAQTGPTALMAPVYPYLLSIFFKIFGPHSEMAGYMALGLNVIFSALVLIPVFILTRRLFNRRAALIAVWVWAILPITGYTDALYIWSTSLLTFTITSFLAFTISLERDNFRGWQLGIYALFAGFIILIEPIAIIVVGVSGLWLAYQKFPVKNLIQCLLTASILPCAWLARNFVVFQEPVFIRSGLGMELSVGIRDNEFEDNKPASLPNRNPAELEKYIQMGELGYMQSRYDEAVLWIKENPMEYVERFVNRVIAYWTGYRVSQIFLFYGKFEMVKRVFFTLPVLGIFLSLFVLKKKHILLVHSILLFYPVVYYITHVELRYRQPLEPLLCVLTIGAVVAIYEELTWRSGNPLQTHPPLTRRFAEPFNRYD